MTYFGQFSFYVIGITLAVVNRTSLNYLIHSAETVKCTSEFDQLAHLCATDQFCMISVQSCVIIKVDMFQSRYGAAKKLL